MHTVDRNAIPTADGEDGELATVRRAGRMALIAGLGVLALTGALVLLVETPSSVTVSDCAAIEDAGLRLGCYDSIARRPPSPPARGALAPKLD